MKIQIEKISITLDKDEQSEVFAVLCNYLLNDPEAQARFKKADNLRKLLTPLQYEHKK